MYLFSALNEPEMPLHMTCDYQLMVTGVGKTYLSCSGLFWIVSVHSFA